MRSGERQVAVHRDGQNTGREFLDNGAVSWVSVHTSRHCAVRLDVQSRQNNRRERNQRERSHDCAILSSRTAAPVRSAVCSVRKRVLTAHLLSGP